MTQMVALAKNLGEALKMVKGLIDGKYCELIGAKRTITVDGREVYTIDGDAELGAMEGQPVATETADRHWVLNAIRHAGAAGITRTKLQPSTQQLTAARRNAALAALVSDGEIAVQKVKTGNRFAEVFSPILAKIVRSRRRGRA